MNGDQAFSAFTDAGDRAWRLKGCFWILVTVLLAFAMRMLEWPAWHDPEFRLGGEWLLATHDAYHWVAGAEGFGFGAGHPMSEMLRLMAKAVNLPPVAVAFWFPAVLSSLVAGTVCAWVWALGSLEAGVAAGLLTSIAPGFLARTLLGFYDTDLVTLFFPLFMTLAPASWAMRFMLVPNMLLQKLAASFGSAAVRRFFGGACQMHFGNPLRWQWVCVLGLSGVVSWWTQEWHSVFPYLIRYNVLLLLCMSLFLAPRGRRKLLLVGAMAYALPALAGPWGFGLSVAVMFAVARSARLQRFFTDWRVLSLLWLAAFWLMVSGEIFSAVANHVQAYLKHAADAKGEGEAAIVFPSVAQSIIEVQDLSLRAALSYFHPWMEASVAGLAGYALVCFRRPGALFLLPLAALAILSTKLGGRMVMFGAPVVAIGIVLPVCWCLQRLVAERFRGAPCGIAASVLVGSLLVAPFLELIPAMSQGPMINRRHAEALARIQTITPKNAMVWLWWDWGYAAHHFSRRATIADGAQHGGPSLYLPAAVFATDNPRFARQLIRYTAEAGGTPGDVFKGMDAVQAQALVERLRSPDTPLVKGKGRQFIVVSFEMLRLGFWISNFGGWNFLSCKGEGGALSIVPQALAYKLDAGQVQVQGGGSPVHPCSINVFEETGVTCRNYVQEWFDSHRDASPEEQKAFLNTRRNVNFFFNRVTGEKLAMDARLYNSLMVQLLLADPQDPRFSPYFKLLYDNVFARVYEVM